MYLSKLILNERDRKVRADLSNAHDLHRTIMQAFPDEQREKPRADWNVLFRQEPDTNIILVQSTAQEKPDWSQLPNGYLLNHDSMDRDSKPFKLQANQLQPNQIFQFRLKANASKRNKETGKVMGLFYEPDQIAWLERQAERCGFMLQGVNVIPTPNIFGKKTKESSPIKIFTVLYQGILQVKEPELVFETICQGVGRGRSYGCGLLSIAKCVS
jgi:CRISPR system Cascade subunit CasE